MLAFIYVFLPAHQSSYWCTVYILKHEISSMEYLHIFGFTTTFALQ